MPRLTFQSTLPRRERLSSFAVSGSAYFYFNPRSREGSDVCRACHDCFHLVFQSTLPRRERLLIFSSVCSQPKFQSTLPRRERRPAAHRSDRHCHFNPRSREGSDSSPSAKTAKYHHFNPRSREGSDERLGKAAPRKAISIHAPAKGATQATLLCNTGVRYFNPRSREGSDLFRSYTPQASTISIHAPAKGATKDGARGSA